LQQIYTDLGKSLPEDPAAAAYLKALRLTAPPPTTPTMVTPLVENVRLVVQAITLVAENNVQRPDQRVAERYGKPYRLSGDELTEVYVRQAANAARSVPAPMRSQAFAIGLAVALDNSSLLRDHPLTRIVWRSFETEREFQFRRAVLGEPTIHGRYDLAQHFSVSAGLAALFGARVSEAAGVWKEQSDAVFSRSDYSADLAGITLFERLSAAHDRLDRIAEKFRVADYLPPCLDADPKLPVPGQSTPFDQNRQLRAEIIKEIERLPAYAGERAAN
jgi:hypothetical protein